jgi:hypothetical protein
VLYCCCTLYEKKHKKQKMQINIFEGPGSPVKLDRVYGTFIHNFARRRRTCTTVWPCAGGVLSERGFWWWGWFGGGSGRVLDLEVGLSGFFHFGFWDSKSILVRLFANHFFKDTQSYPVLVLVVRGIKSITKVQL